MSVVEEVRQPVPDLDREKQWFSRVTAHIRHDAVLQEQAGQPGVELQIPEEGFYTFLEILNNLPERETQQQKENDRQTVAVAFAIASWAHGEHRRNSGESYIHHPLWVAKYLTQYNVPAAAIAAYILHDVPEDSAEHGHPVYLEDIEWLMPKQDADLCVAIVDGLTKVKGLPNVDEEFVKIYDESTKNSLVLLGKIGDRLHNLVTIDGHKKITKRHEVANETLRALVPIARFFGFRKEARILADRSFVIKKVIEGDKQGLLDLYQTMIEVYTGEKQAEIADFFAPLATKGHFRVSSPGMYELCAIHEKETKHRALPNKDAYWFNLEFAVDRKYCMDERSFVRYTNGFIDDIRFEHSDTINLPEVVGYSSSTNRAVKSTARRLGVDYQVIYTFSDGSSMPLRIRMYPEPLYHQRTTPLSTKYSLTSVDESGFYPIGLSDPNYPEIPLYLPYFPSVHRPLTHQQAKGYATASIESFQQYSSSIDTTDIETYINMMQLGQPDGIQVTGIGSTENIDVYVPEKSTPIDYAIIWLPKGWFRIHEVFINNADEPLTDFTYNLQPGDTIRFTSKASSTIHPSWLSAINTTEQKRQLVIEKLKEKLESLHRKLASDNSEDNFAIYNEFKRALMSEGRKRLMKEITQPIGPVRLNYLLNEGLALSVPADEFLSSIALGNISDEEISRVARAAISFWNKLDKITIRVTDDPKTSGIAKELFAAFDKAGIGLLTYGDDTEPFEEVEAKLTFWVNPQQKNYHKVESVIKSFDWPVHWERK